MKKFVIILGVILIIILGIYYLFRPNVAKQVNIPSTLTVEYLIDPNSNIKDDREYYIVEGNDFHDPVIENKYNTKYISEFSSTGFKNTTRISKQDLLKILNKKIVAVYYTQGPWWSRASDSCVAIITNNQTQNYLVGIYNTTLCQNK